MRHEKARTALLWHQNILFKRLESGEAVNIIYLLYKCCCVLQEQCYKQIYHHYRQTIRMTGMIPTPSPSDIVKFDSHVHSSQHLRFMQINMVLRLNTRNIDFIGKKLLENHMHILHYYLHFSKTC